ncbi:DMT family transporter [Rhodopila sp.]|jgi:drug/metabolite transporter (DMT)-like permease|uniref:DMT family transporter n=1 Tax=Rhodopila sp. TaxID=2480087 RepID=UPI002CCC857E|nr:DMT family transporter [Rhodopila sp.]HVZ08899.1 DMT family transporter [Rhodopila sp.]
MPADDPVRGIAFTVVATMLFAASDTIAKYLSNTLPIVEFIWIRYLLFLVMALVLSARVPRRVLRPRAPALQVARGVCVVASSLLFVFGVHRMTMAQATTISFLSPMLVTILSIPLLGEVVGIRRWAAVGAGLAGMLVVVRPGLADFQPAALFGIASATAWTLALIITRKIAGTDAPQTTMLVSSVFGSLVLSVLLPFQAVWPTAWELALAVTMGVLASIGQWLVILAHRIAPASTLAPLFYTQLIWATLTGLLVFGNLPDAWTVAGAVIIVLSGLYTAHRERVRRAARAPA